MCKDLGERDAAGDLRLALTYIDGEPSCKQFDRRVTRFDKSCFVVPTSRSSLINHIVVRQVLSKG
jgi:hypothetical protein